ncbi:protein SHQ1 homolog [Ixodes scapularis]|uniref:protein SHQ1 homolog n=1 Tax=Ixodes scapularis TaxID=6945 RepID=UPI001C382218|nr:protein SHQ1 homolog [Ixodes scapularis]
MLTPAFELRQDNSFLIIEIKAPYSKISDAEIYFHDEDFKFYSKPYYLRLNLPGKVIENGNESAKYETDNGTFVINMPKQYPGEVFTGLDLLTKLLAPNPKPSTSTPLIEVVGNEEAGLTAGDAPDEEFDWQVEQTPWTADDEASLLQGSTRKYGFDRQRTGVIARVKEELPDIVDIVDPEHKSVRIAREERLAMEAEHFSDEHYLADLYEPAAVEGILAYTAPWSNLASRLGDTNDPAAGDAPFQFTEDEKTKMRNLPRKEYLLDKQTEASLLLGLVDILFAYAYNVRVTEGDNNVESGWTVSKLSATLSWFEEFWSLEQTVRCCVRRSLVYPLHRHWALSRAVVTDVGQILRLGPRYVLRCLLDVHSMFNKHDSRYVLNDLYVTDYAVWVQSVKPKVLHSLADALKQVKVHKEDVGLDLSELESGALLAVQEASAETSVSVNAVEASMGALCISNPLATALDPQFSGPAVAKPASAGAQKQTDVTTDSSSTDSDDSSSSCSSDSTGCSDSTLDSDDELDHTDSDDEESDSESDGVDQCLLFVKDPEPEKRR